MFGISGMVQIRNVKRTHNHITRRASRERQVFIDNGRALVSGLKFPARCGDLREKRPDCFPAKLLVQSAKPEVRRPGHGEIRSDPLDLNETCSAWRSVLLIYVKEIPAQLRLA